MALKAKKGPAKPAPAKTKLKVSAAKKATPAVEAAAPTNRLTNYYLGRIAGIDRKLDLLAGQSAPSDPISTGSLVANYVMTGGIYPVFNSLSGPEASGKTTLSVSSLGEAFKYKVPFLEYHDAEGCVVASTRIAVEDGTVPIGTLFEGIDLASTPVGPLAETARVKAPCGQLVDATLYYGGVKETTAMRLEDGTELVGADHPVLVVLPDGTGQWRMIEDVKEGDVVLSH